MLYEQCKWYKRPKPDSPLDNFLKERTPSNTDISSVCENDTQIMTVNYIQCVKLDEIKKVEPWSPQREESIRKWATPDKLRRLKYYFDEDTNKRVIPSTSFHDMPMLYREYKLDSQNQEKFKIADGIHRINRARELCRTPDNCQMDCILTSVEEHVKVNKTDIKNVEVR